MTFRSASLAVCLAFCCAVESSALPSGETHLPHVANGSCGDGSFRSTFILFNYGDENGSVRLRLTRDDAQPLVVTIPGLGTGSDLTVGLPPGSTTFLQTDGSGNLTTGAAGVTPSDDHLQTAVSSVPRLVYSPPRSPELRVWN